MRVPTPSDETPTQNPAAHSGETDETSSLSATELASLLRALGGSNTNSEPKTGNDLLDSKEFLMLRALFLLEPSGMLATERICVGINGICRKLIHSTDQKVYRKRALLLTQTLASMLLGLGCGKHETYDRDRFRHECRDVLSETFSAAMYAFDGSCRMSRGEPLVDPATYTFEQLWDKPAPTSGDPSSAQKL